MFSIPTFIPQGESTSISVYRLGITGSLGVKH